MPNLIFQKLTISNFGSYLGTHTIDLDSPPNFVYIKGINKVNPALGSNDCGKTTLVHAIYWILTGKTLRSSRPAAAIEPWDNHETVCGSLTFSRNGNPYTVARTRRPNGLWLDGAVATQEQVTAALGLSDEVLSNTVIVGQFSALFLSLKPEQQSALFAELLGLDIWLGAVNVCSERYKEVDKALRDTEARIAKSEGRLIEIASQEETNLKAEKAFEIERREILDDYNIRLQELQDQAKQVAANIDKLGKGPILNADHFEKQVEDVQGKEKILVSVIHVIEVSTASYERELKDVIQKLEDYTTTDSVCPECGQPVDQDHIDEVITELSHRQKIIREKIEDDKQVIVKHQKNLATFRENITNVKKEIAAIRSETSEWEREHNKLLMNQSGIERDIVTIERDIRDTNCKINPHTGLLKSLVESQRRVNKELEAYKSKQKELDEIAGMLDLWSKGFKQIRLDLIDEALLELEVTVKKHLARLGLPDWEIIYETERETKGGDIQHKFTPNIFPPGLDHSVPLETLGGGISTRLQLSDFFGRSEVLLARAGIEPNLEILDEPTRMLSEEGVDDLLEALRERVRDTNRSIYFIDHSQRNHGAFDKVIEIVKDENGSRIVE